MRVHRFFDVNPIRGLLALALSYKVNFDPEDGLGWINTILMIEKCHDYPHFRLFKDDKLEFKTQYSKPTKHYFYDFESPEES